MTVEVNRVLFDLFVVYGNKRNPKLLFIIADALDDIGRCDDASWCRSWKIRRNIKEEWWGLFQNGKGVDFFDSRANARNGLFGCFRDSQPVKCPSTIISVNGA